MKIPLVMIAGFVLASCAITSPTSSSTSTVTPALRTEFAPSGTLVMAVNYGNIVHTQKDPAGGPARGVAPELARELARRLGLPIGYVTYEIAGKVADAAKEGAWDLAFLAVDPARAKDISFSTPYVLIQGTYLVRKEATLQRVTDFDRPGMKIAVGLKSAYDLHLSRELKFAEPVRYPTSQAAVDAFLAGKDGLGAVAGVRQLLEATARKDSAFRVIDGAYMSIDQAAGVPNGRPNAARYLRDFIEEMKASGFVARKLAESGNADATIAPPAR
ncbi:MAG: transporter substrate-binding domain-containing protein [Usitatibacter sp.]